MAVTARKYNPGFLTDDELVASFCVRTVEFEMLVEVLRECTGPSNPHQIVIGPRGSGKTILLLRIAAEVRRDAELSAGFFPVVFAEESYEVGTAGEFWLECLSRVASQAPRREGAPDLHRTFEELRTVRNDQELADRCLGALLDFSDREGKRLVLMVENLGMIFRDMADADAGWRLRKILQTEPRIVLLASATSRFDEIDDPKHALYDFFSVRTLRPLDTSECAALWEAVSGRRPPPGTIRSLEILTGGSPRLITIVARFGAELSFRKLMANLLDLIDDHTEYFKSHLESLPAQERRVYLALAALWKPATTREISDQARMETSKCSAQLTRLIGRGVVQSAGGTARRKQYYLTERLYNIYYLLRRSRRSDRLVEALIHFMESYYSPSELKDIGARIVREVENFSAEMQSLSRAALAQLMELPAMATHREELLAIIPEGFAVFLGQRSASADAVRAAEAGMKSDHPRADRLHGDTDEDEELVAEKLLAVAVALGEQDQTEDALAVYDEVVRRFGETERPAVLELAAMALVKKGLVLDELNRAADALAAYDEAVHRFGESETLAVLDLLGTALVMKGRALQRLNRLADALVAYDEVVLRFGGDETSILVQCVAKALINKGLVLRRLDRAGDALAAYDEVVRRFREDETTLVVSQVAEALINKGLALDQMNLTKDALAVYDEVFHRFGAIKTDTVLPWVAMALTLKGLALQRLNRADDALTVYDEVGNQFKEYEATDTVVQVAIALVSKGDLLSGMNRPHDALAAYGEVVRRFGDDKTSLLVPWIAKALIMKALMLQLLDRADDSLATCDEVVRRLDGTNTPILVQQIARALGIKAFVLRSQNRAEDALSVYEEVVRRFGEVKTPVLVRQVAEALVNKGHVLQWLNRTTDALAAYDEVVRRFRGDEAPTLVEQVAEALVDKGNLLARLNRPDDALTAYREAVNRFGGSESPSLGEWVDDALLGMTQIELKARQYEAAVKTAARVLDQRQPELPDTRLRGHLMRARAVLMSGNRSACERDVDAGLALLPEIGSLARESLDAFMFFSVALGPERMCELIKASPSASLLLPLTTALERELGLNPRVAREVEEVAEDIRRELVRFKETGTDGAI